ncbi:MAG: hypothetical protein IJP92_05320 [Lachnospiraceae bacterium]|nr:hypothetical protein [Lachnospiraceae bacterium]
MMKKKTVTCIAALLASVVLAGCGGGNNSAATASSAAPAADATESTTADSAAAETSAAAAEASAAEAAETVLINISAEGMGYIAYSEDGSDPVFDQDFPSQTAFTNVPKGTSLIIDSMPGEDEQLIKWTKNGEYVSNEPRITVTAEEDAEYRAVFGMKALLQDAAATVSDVSEIKTLADVFSLPSYQSAMTEEQYAYVFDLKGNIYRAITDLPKETSDELWAMAAALDYEELQVKQTEVLAPLAVSRVENITDLIPTQEELDQYIGKTGADLLHEGWTCNGCYLDTMEFYMGDGPFFYTVTFDGQLEMTDDFSEEEAIRDLTITSVTYTGLGDVADPSVPVE